MKFRAHDTFFIRKGWLNKGLSQVKRDSSVFISKTQNPMDVFGIGNNMVKALRYWMQVTGLTEEPEKGKRVQEITDFGKLVFENDRYIDETGTLLLLHYKLATNEKDATAWYYFFNKFTFNEFTKEDFVREIQNYIQMSNEDEVAIRSLEDDFACILSTYQSRSKSGAPVSPENNIDCPLGELGLIDVLDKKEKKYRKATPSKELFDPWIIMAVISKWSKDNGNVKEVTLNDLLMSPCNIGRVFNLDTITMLDILYKTEKLGRIKINRTAGLDVVVLNDVPSFEDCIAEYYKGIKAV